MPYKAALAAAVHKRLGGVQKKKRLSRLKRIILRERASKAVEAATATLEAARAHVEQAAVTQGSIQAQLQVRCVPPLGNCLTLQGNPGCKPHVLSQSGDARQHRMHRYCVYGN